MDDYIKREDAARVMAILMAAEAEADGYPDAPIDNYIEYASEDLADIPSADVAPVVRCRDCKFAHMTYGGECKYCDAWESEESLYLDGDFFCAFGERKDDE